MLPLVDSYGMAVKSKIKSVFLAVLVLGALAAVSYIGRGFYYRAMTVHELLTENKQLKKAITNLTVEEQIGYAKVVSQQLFT